MRQRHPSLDDLKAEMIAIASYCRRYLWAARLEAENTRLCRWTGQSSDGLKHESDIGDVPEPFEGGTDLRVRLADQLVNEEVMLLVIGALRAQMRVQGVESSDMQKAAQMTLVLQWVLRDYLGVRWVRELIRLANYYCGDSPGVAMMRVWWNKEQALGLEKVDPETLAQMYLERVALEAESRGEDPQAVLPEAEEAILMALAGIQDAENEEAALALAGLLMTFFPDISEKRARKAVRDLRKDGKAEFPVPYFLRNGPEVAARRFMEDWWCSVNLRDFEKAPVWFETEWLTRMEILERQATQGWKEGFVKAVVGEVETGGTIKGGLEGVAAFPEYVYQKDTNLVVERPREFFKGLYQIVTAYYMGADEDGIPGKYFVILHGDVAEFGTKPAMIDDASGRWPGEVLQREVLTGRILDSRGIPETAGPFQGPMKMFADSFGDHAQIAGVPPIITRGRQRMGVLRIRPLEELQAKRDGDFKWLQPPQYPATVDNMMKEIRRQVDEYYGRTNEQVAPDVVTLHKMFKTMWFLIQLREVVRRIMQQCQENMPEEMLARITNAQGEPLVRTREEIQGSFDLNLVFDPADLDPEHLEKLASIVKDLLMGMDRDQTIQAAPVVASLFYRLAPDLAAAALQPVDKANQEEMQDEIEAYQQVRAGIEPDLPDDGSVNYPLRMSLYENMQKMNPAIFDDLSEDKRAILESRLQRLGVLSQQYGENVQIGRQGGKTALGGG